MVASMLNTYGNFTVLLSQGLSNMTSPQPPDLAISVSVSYSSLDVSAWSNLVLGRLNTAGQEGEAAVSFIKSRNIKIGFRKQKSTGAMWSLNGNIYLNANNYSLSTLPTNAFMLSLVAHEALHLKQGIETALSVYGELEAWQLGIRIYQTLGGRIISSALNELMGLQMSYDRDMLKKVRFLMQEYAGKGYRIDLLPLFPAWKELGYFFTGKTPTE
jgi:hypothetical protein